MEAVRKGQSSNLLPLVEMVKAIKGRRKSKRAKLKKQLPLALLLLLVKKPRKQGTYNYT